MEIRDDEHYGVESDIPKFVMVPNWVLEIRVNGQPLPPQAIHIYSVLMYHVNNETRKCFPAYTTLESMTGMSRSTIWKYLKILKDAGVLTWERRAFKGFTTSNKYFLPHKPLKDVELYKQESYITEKEVAEDETSDSGFELDTLEDSGFGVSEEAGIQKKRTVTAPDAFMIKLQENMGYKPEGSEYARWNKVLNKIRSITDNPDDITLAFRNYPKYMPKKNTTFTLEALAKHFQALINYKDDTISSLERLENLKIKDNVIDV